MSLDLSSPWMYWLGIICLARGALSLVLNEFTVWAARLKPWWRDDDSTARDDRLREYQRVGMFALSIVYIELGRFLSAEQLTPFGIRLGLYFLFEGNAKRGQSTLAPFPKPETRNREDLWGVF